MKSKDFAQILLQVADLSRESLVRQGVNELATAFDQAGAATVAGTLKRAVAADTTGQGVSTGPLLSFMKQVQALLTLAGKPAVAKDFNEVMRLIQQYPVIAFASSPAMRRAAGTPRASTKVSTALSTDLVNSYDNELSATLGNESDFAAIYSRLLADARMRPSELRELSRKFAGAPGKTKAEALRKIWSRHQNLLMMRAKDRAIAGRSAA